MQWSTMRFNEARAAASEQVIQAWENDKIAIGDVLRSKEKDDVLQLASFRGQVKLVQPMLDAGANVNASLGIYDTALMAAIYGNQPQVVSLLIDKGADVSFQSGIYMTPLTAACSLGYLLVAQVLIDGGADVNRHDDLTNSSPLDEAEGNMDMVQLLRRNGAHK